MKHPKQQIRCETCKGYKRVAMLGNGIGPFQKLVGHPLPMLFVEARRMLLDQKEKVADRLAWFTIDDAIRGLGTTPCPWCKATGYSFEIRQLTDEEAAKYR